MSDTPRIDAILEDGFERGSFIANARDIERERNILFAAITEAVARFDKLSWGWDGDCGTGNIMRELEEARDKVCTLNPSHHDGAAPAPSVDGVVLGRIQEE